MNDPAFLTVFFAVFFMSGCATTDELVIVSFAPLSVTKGNEQAADGFTPLHTAARDGEAETVQKLLHTEKHIDAVSTETGSTALVLAATAGHKQIVDALLEAGAAVNATDKYDGTALMYASSKGYAGIVEILLQHGAAVNAVSPKDRLDSTALCLAAGNGHEAVLELLLKADANMDWRTERDGSTAMMLAAELGHGNTVRLLLSAGANPDLNNRNGKTACDLAAANGHGRVTMMLDDFYLSHGQGKRCRL